MLKRVDATYNCENSTTTEGRKKRRKELHMCSKRHQNRVILDEVKQQVSRISSSFRPDELPQGRVGERDITSDNGMQSDEYIDSRKDICNEELQSDKHVESENNLNCNPLLDSDYELDSNVNHDITTVHNDDCIIGSEDNQELTSALSQWAIKYHIRHNACNELLSILNPNILNCSLPRDSRTLMNTPRESKTLTMDEGEYIHFGIDAALQSIMKKHASGDGQMDIDNLKLSLNIDGLPVSSSSTNSFWPILVADEMTKSVEMVGVYYGKKKPASANDYLAKFIEELKPIINEGFFYNNRKIGVSLCKIICDAPAKSFILYTKYHIGYSSCSKCTITGVTINRTTCFPYEERPSRLRTDEDFVFQTDDDYHRGRTILLDLPNVGLVTNVPLDYMHLICLGTVKKLLLLLLKGPLSVRIKGSNIDCISKKLISIAKMVPSEFARKPRGLLEISNWKATEFRQFLLYTGPIVLKSHINDDIYQHFLTLHVAISILVSPQLIKEEFNIKYAESLLNYFVKNFEIIYGKQFMSHNIHNLLHLCNDVRNFGVLDNFSAFPFENFLSRLKIDIRKPEKPLQQLARRYGERKKFISFENLFTSNKFIPQNQHFDGPLTADVGNIDLTQYKILRTSSLIINCKDSKNNCVLLRGDIIINVMNILKIENNGIFFVGSKYKVISEVYNRPFSSKVLNIYKILDENEALSRWEASLFEKKMYKIRDSTSQCYVIQIRHDVTLE